MSGGRRTLRRTAPRVARSLLNLILVVLLGGFAAAALVRYSPGFDVDENDWNPKLSAETRAALHVRNERNNRLLPFYARYLYGVTRGEFGESESCSGLPVSSRLILQGTSAGLLLGAALAWMAVWPRRAALGFFASAVSGLLLAIPPAVMALAFFFAEAPLGLAVALALLPRVFGTLRAVLQELAASPALLAARARGVRPAVLLFRYGIAPATPQLIALTGVSLVISFGSLIPIEALCDVPGIGQLAWKAALSRDLPLLSALALLITFTVAAVQTVGELVEGGME
jgi:peptide/nickel transport system permease protein